MGRILQALLLASTLGACGGGSSQLATRDAVSAAGDARWMEAAASGAQPAPQAADDSDVRFQRELAELQEQAAGADAVRVRTGYSPSGDRRYAQAEQQPGEEEQASDATHVPLLIYTAELDLAVHQVTEKQDRVEALAREAGGFLATRTNDTIVVRVPARTFDAVMAQIQELGDVVSRRIQVQDVSEEFHDVQTRIQTLEAMRRRVEQLLAQAHDVQAALAVEQQLERITVELEQLRGRLRFLADRVSFSTITVRFRERAETTEPQFELPFQWLRDVGLQRLLRL